MIISNLNNSFSPCPKNISKKEKVTTKIKQKSNRLAKKEKDRTSILQANECKCFLCIRTFKKLDKHEAFCGSNRQKSIEYELIYYLCRECHSKADVDKNIRQYLHNFAREKFIEKYSKEKFLKEFGKNYF